MGDDTPDIDLVPGSTTAEGAEEAAGGGPDIDLVPGSTTAAGAGEAAEGGPEDSEAAGGGPEDSARGTAEYQTEEGSDIAAPKHPPPRIDADIPGSEDPSWFKIAQGFGYESVAACRDNLDAYNWRRVEAQAHAARQARERQVRPIEPGAGGYAGRAYRQINVKLGVADFDAVVALSMRHDVPYSTMARMLIRSAITKALKVDGGGGL